MNKLPFIGGAYAGRAPVADTQRLVNWFVETDQREDRSRKQAVPTPGLTELAEFGAGTIRGLYAYNGLIFVVSGPNFYSATQAGLVTSLGSLNTSSGPVYFADNGVANGHQLMLADGDHGYIYDSDAQTFTMIDTADLPAPVSVVFQDGYFLTNDANSGRVRWSAGYDGTSWPPLQFATAEGDPDNTVRIISDHRLIWVFGERSTELWYDSGDADFTFQRYQGGFIERGCAAAASVVKSNNALIWLSRDAYGWGQVLMGASPEALKVLSTPQLEYQWSYAELGSAHAFAYQSQGHDFYVLTIPTIGRTFVYDHATQEWHERASGNAQWRAHGYCVMNGVHYVGDYASDKVYAIDTKNNTEDGVSITRTLVSPHINDNDRRLFFAAVQVIADSGNLSLAWSKDGGETFTPPITKAALPRAVWRRLGVSRDWVFKLTTTDQAVVLNALGEAR